MSHGLQKCICFRTFKWASFLSLGSFSRKMQKGVKFRKKKIWFKHANVSLNMPSFSNRLIFCSALIMAGWLLERGARKKKKSAFSLWKQTGNTSKDAETFRIRIGRDQRRRIKGGGKSSKERTGKKRGVKRHSPTDVDSCGAEGRWVRQQIKHRENVFLCGSVEEGGAGERHEKKKALPECRTWMHQLRGGF